MTDEVESEAVSEEEVCIIAIDSGCVHMEQVDVHCVGTDVCVVFWNNIGWEHAWCVCVCVCVCVRGCPSAV